MRVRASYVASLVAALCFALAYNGAAGLRHARVRSPLAVERGGDVELRCEYDLEADALYAVKWYRGDREFCRYSPREEPPLKVFPLHGIDVDVLASDAERLTLRGVSRAAAGRYTCEVSADAPSFHTALVNTTLAVVDIPAAGPELRGIEPRYRSGALLHAECACRDSLPPANITFYINDVRASASYVRHRIEGGSGELMSASSTLHFLVHPHHFLGGKMKVRCTASIYSLYWQITEKSAVEERVRKEPARTRVDASPLPEDALVYPVQGQLPHTTAADADNAAGWGPSRGSRPITLAAVVVLLNSCYKFLRLFR